MWRLCMRVKWLRKDWLQIFFANPQSEVAKELIRKDTGSDIDADSRLDAVREKDRQRLKAVRRYESYSPRIQLLSL